MSALLIKTFIVFILFAVFAPLSAQELRIRDASSGSSLPFVLVYAPDQSFETQTDVNGQVKLPQASASDSLILQLVGYRELRIAYPTSSLTVKMRPESYSLHEIVVSANRWEQNKSEISQSIGQLDQQQLKLQQAPTAADLIGGQAHVYVQKSQLGGGSPMIRGFSANRVLLVVDGVRMNNAIFRSGNLQNIISIDPHIIENTEVLFGPGAVMYGSDAMGGVMDFHTLRPSLSFTNSKSIRGKVLSRYSSAASEGHGHLQLEYGGRRWSAITSASLSRWGDLKMGQHGPEEYLRTQIPVRVNGEDRLVDNEEPRVQKETGYDQINLFQKAVFAISSREKIEWTSIYTQTSDIPRYERQLRERNGFPRSAEWYYGPQKWSLNYLQYSSTRTTAWYDHLKARAAFQWFEESRNDRNWNSEWLRERRERVYAPSINMDLEKQWNKLSLFYGLDANYNFIRSKAQRHSILSEEREPLGSRYPDQSHWFSAALYLSSRYQLSPSTYLNTALRGDYMYLSAPFNASSFPLPVDAAKLDFGNLSGSIGLTKSFNDRQRALIQFSTGFRAPNIDDIGKVFDSEPGAVVIPNPQLRPEYAYSLDLGYTQIVSKQLKIELNAFGTILESAMVRRPFQFNGQDSITYDGAPSQVQAIQNAASGFVYGGTIAAHYSPWSQWEVYGRVNWQRGRTTEESDSGNEQLVPLRHAAPTFGQVGLKWLHNGWSALAQFDFNGPQNPQNMAPSETNKPHIYLRNAEGLLFSPSWHRLDLRLRKEWRQWGVTLAFENLTNQRYRPYSSAIVAPGRNFIASLEYRW
jgi:hemoglobin/transferrin/lactoferrin receptor protein